MRKIQVAPVGAPGYSGRMENKTFIEQSADYRRVEAAIGYLESRFKRQPGLDEIAASVNLSKYHFERLFKRWAGVTPIQFMQFLTLQFTRERLAAARSILDTALDAGLSGPSRLHDLFVTFQAMTPGEEKKKGAGLRIDYGFHPSPFGECLLGLTHRGICHLGFVTGEDRAAALGQLRQLWPEARLAERRRATGAVLRRIFAQPGSGPARPFHLLLRGTNFQVNVWRALLGIPAGTVVSYQDVAAWLGKPAAARAVGNALAVNPVGFLIPCHRVINCSGGIHRYRWGTARKKAMVAWEAARFGGEEGRAPGAMTDKKV